MSTSHVLRHFHPPEAARFFHNAAWATRHSSRQNCIPGPHSTCRELQLGRMPKQVSIRISPSEFTYILYTYKIYTLQMSLLRNVEEEIVAQKHLNLQSVYSILQQIMM